MGTITVLRKPRLVGALAMAGFLLAAGEAVAVSGSPQGEVRGFYDNLLGTMKAGPSLGGSGRYARLAPVVGRLFDIPFMARLATGQMWASMTPAQQQRVVAAFGRYIAATYADRFDNYSGEQLQVEGQQPYGANVIVRTRIIKADGKPVTINYLMHRAGGGWQVADVYVDGTISQLATERSEFDAILRQQGVQGLITKLNSKADFLARTS